MRKPNILFIGALCAMIILINAEPNEERTDNVEEPAVQKIHVLQPGEKEYLSPNLIGVQNIAITNIPVTLNFINIIDAYREVVDGVRYEVVLNAVNTTDNNTEIVCRIVVLEKPWLTTLWGDKVRLLKESNCTNEELQPDSFRDSKALEEKYETNAIFSGNRNELTPNDMSNLESQIIGSSNNPQLTKQRAANPLPSTTESIVSTTEHVTESIENAEQTNSNPIQLEANGDEGSSDKLEPVVSSSSESTTTEKIPELNDNEKKWLDDFLSIGAYNFETSLENKNLQNTNSEAQESDKKDGLVGGPKQFDADEIKANQEILSKSLDKIKSGDAPPYVIDKCLSGSSQVVAGTLVKLDCQMVHKETGEKDRCLMSLWSRPWLKEDGYEVTFECKNAPKSVHRHSRSTDEKPRSVKLTGNAKPLKEFELKEQEGRVSQSLAKLASGDGPSYSISKVFSGTKQTVAGSLVKLYAELIDGSTGAKENCTVSLWSRPWIPIDGYEVTFECKDKQKIVHRHSRSIEYAEKKTNKKSSRSLDKVEHLFQKFQTQYKRQYQNTMERQMRLRIFKHNLKLIHDLNKNELGSAKYGITEFADMTTTEYRDRTGLLSRAESNSVRSPAKIPDVELPKEFDWREKGAISKVKNQGSCGSCWAFSVTGNIEGLHAVRTGNLEEYSEQELLDCDTIDSACNGGLPDNAYKAIENIGGLELESQYPYEAKKKQCHYNSTLTRVKISGAVDLPKNETEMAKFLIANGPISIGINANAMQFYRGGVSHPWKMLCSKKNLDHGVLIVGYGVSEYPTFKKTLPYWIVKNSWGPKWGEQGYYRVYRGDNTCGVSEMATSAVLA
ncbi:putative cysteine proteinase CG12163 [Eupeodes corollae]|uniref:putative cysteine proteinase CG12163 n=1 Tax=Eupeodes corollae TaxID=290404 RepID=UPI002490325C|nr:putative cysteine proteinase CG12163 [Eupeodes corollae]